jgi:hydroxymethylpyrimidine/phosphomethylpyrimidine kinase
MDQTLDSGFRPGMGNVVPDRFFWALPPTDEDGDTPPDDAPPPEPEMPDTKPKGAPRRIH